MTGKEPRESFQIEHRLFVRLGILMLSSLQPVADGQRIGHLFTILLSLLRLRLPYVPPVGSRMMALQSSE